MQEEKEDGFREVEKGGAIMEECDYKCKSCKASCIITASTENLLAMGINCSRYSGVTDQYLMPTE